MVADVKAVAVIDVGDCTNEDQSNSVARYAQRSLRGQSVLSRVARRISEAAMVGNVAITGGNIPARVLTAGISGTTVLNLPHSHVTERLALAADRTDSEWVVYLPANRPFVDPVLIDRLLCEAMQHNECDYVGYFSTGGGWRRMQHLGLAGEICHTDALRRLRRNVDRLAYCEGESSLAAFFQDAPGSYQMRFIPVPPELDRSDLRFAIESENDWHDIQLLSDTVPNDNTHWQPLATLVLANANLRESMQGRNVNVSV